MKDPLLPFERDVEVDEPGIVGARWWNEGLKATAKAISRRNLLTGLVIASAVVGAAGLGVYACTQPDEDDAIEQRRAALDMQREYGWSFGAVTEALVFDGSSQTPFDRQKLAVLAQSMKPASPSLAPFYVPTLFESLTATPKGEPKGDPGKVVPLVEALRPIATAPMVAAYGRGRGVAALFAKKKLGVALIVDLAGPEAVAFAAGAAAAFDPVFLFDNWPHPRGVVGAHRTLAAAAYYQPLFERSRSERPAGSPPMFVLDRTRLAPYTDDATQFDNRHVARLPSADALARLEVGRVLYVVPSDPNEPDDVNGDLADYAEKKLDVRMVSGEEFFLSTTSPAKTPPDPETFPFRGDGDHDGFWALYPWSKQERPPAAPPASLVTTSWVPKRSATAYRDATGHAKPAGFGSVPVMVAVIGGAILGAKLSRSGSWNRAGGGWGG